MVPERTQARANPARGLALIATAVIVGIFLLRNGNFDGGSTLSDDASAIESEDDSGDGTSDTTAVPQGRPPAEITVRVANATDVGGAAGVYTDLLAGEGYLTVEPTDAPEGTDPSTTVVLYAAGFEIEAANLATAVGSLPEAITPLSDPPQVDPAGAQLVVLLGLDRAQPPG